jgi:uncharacterized protein
MNHKLYKINAINIRFFCFTLMFVCLALLGFAQSSSDLFPPKPVPAVYVHDDSGWLNGSQKEALEIKLRRYWDSTSTQIIVMIRRDIGDYDKASYAFELGKRWGIGRKDKDNGVVMLIKSEPPERGIFIATGYGTEGALPDITCARIVRNTMAPYFKRQQFYEGINAGLDDIILALKGEFKAEHTDGSDDADTALLVVALVFFTVFLLFLFIFLRARRNGTWYTHSGGPHSSRRSSHLPQSGGGGGWWIGGGGWSSGGGGGGWSGGDSGGFSGGDFGGGDFGGGGAGGDW